ncbi:MAG TPA: GNAT family N-acetyltransferase [Rubrobacter sp.]|nr:GNAT family N-acetyltransferase [Rubrobacter sp.]
MLEEETRKRILEGLRIGALEASEVAEAVDVVARSFRDNPLSFAINGEDPQRRLRGTQAFISAGFDVLNYLPHTLVARDAGDKIVGVCGTLAPGEGDLTLAGKLRLVWGLVPTGPRALLLTMRMLGAWEKHHPEEPYWYLGPVAVEGQLQGMGVGSQLMRRFCARMDEVGGAAYLEADKEINVRFYERFGFEVISEEEVLSAPNWFMFRRPHQ